MKVSTRVVVVGFGVGLGLVGVAVLALCGFSEGEKNPRM
jgi:hypothetical protein